MAVSELVTLLQANTAPTVALNSPADTATGVSTTPQLQFTGTDVDGDAIRYEVEVDTVNTFDSQVSSISLIQQVKALWDGSGALNQTPINTAFASNITAGSTIVVVIGSFQWQVDSITDTLGNTYARAVTETNGGGSPSYTDIWYAYSPTGGANTVSPHYTNVGGTNHQTTVVFSEWSGIAKTSPVGNTNGNTNTGTSVSPGSVTPTINGSLVIGIATDYDGTDKTVTYNTGAGYAKLDEQLGDSATYLRFYSEYLIQGTAASTTASYTLGASSTWEASAAVFSPNVAPLIDAISGTNAGFTDITNSSPVVSDNWDDNTIHNPPWISFNFTSGSVVAANQELELSVAATTNASECGVYSTNLYDFRGKRIQIQNVALPSGDCYPDLGIQLEAQTSANADHNYLIIGVDTGLGMFQASQKVADSFSVLHEVTFNATTHKYWAIREEAGTIYWEYSSDGTTWNTLYSEVAPFSVASAYILIDNYEYDTLTSPTPWKVDNFSFKYVGDFPSGDQIGYTVQSALSNSTLYYWRVRAIDPTGTNGYGAWATTRSFTTASAGGSSIKTVLGLAVASWKTWNGLAKASIKSINGLT